MPRIRSVKPEFFDSEGTAEASLPARLLFIAMWCWADDWGIGDANPRRLLGFAFPNDDEPHGIPRNFPELAGEVSRCYGVVWYEAEGRQWFYIPSWDQHQRTDKRSTKRNPTPDQAKRSLYESKRDISGNPPELPGNGRSGTGEQGNRGTSSSSEIADAIPDPERPEVEQLCELLADLIEGNGAKRPTITKKWRDSARLLIDKDGYTIEQITWLIRWCQQDEFWRSNIMSMPKLREKFDQLKLKATGGGKVTPLRPSVDPNWALR